MGPREYVIAKRFDVDKDGKLNAEEKKAALNAIKEGVESNYVWNIEQAGSKRTHRILQKRGVIIDAEDYTEMKETYPMYPDSSIVPKVKTLNELKEIRKCEIINNLSIKKEEWDKANPSKIDVPYILSEYLIDKPKYTSSQQMKAEKDSAFRIRNGLQEATNDVKNSPYQISDKYNESPEVHTMSELNNRRKDLALKHLSENADSSHLGEIRRMKIKEESVYYLNRLLGKPIKMEIERLARALNLYAGNK